MKAIIYVKEKLGKFYSGVKQWFDALTVQGLLKFALLLVILHLLLCFVRPLSVHITHKTIRSKQTAKLPTLTKKPVKFKKPATTQKSSWPTKQKPTIKTAPATAK